MVTIREAVARLVSFFRKDHRDREFDQELAAHIEMATADHIHEGLPAPEARRRALARLGGIEPAKQLHREARGMPLLDGFPCFGNGWSSRARSDKPSCSLRKYAGR